MKWSMKSKIKYDYTKATCYSTDMHKDIEYTCDITEV